METITKTHHALASDPVDARERLDGIRTGFISQLSARLAELHHLTHEPWSKTMALQLHFGLHKLAGSAATFGFAELSQAARAFEKLLQPFLSEEVVADKKFLDASARLWQGVDRQARAVLVGESASRVLRSPRVGVAQSPLVYLLEDDQVLAGAIAGRLATAGYHVETFRNAEALRQSDKRPAAVVMDMTQAQGSNAGLAVMQKIADGGQLPLIIAMGADDDMATRLGAHRAGAARYLKKPLDLERLTQMLDGMLGRAEPMPFKVLLVDDDELVAAYGELVLASAGMVVRTLADPMRALEVAREMRPDVLVLDVYMPGMNGVELAAILREEDEFALTPILFLTGESDPIVQIQALRAGGDEFLVKPIEPELLVAAVDARARRSRHLQRLSRPSAPA